MDYIVTRDESESLQHHGIKGMKWGIRKPETRARYERMKNKITGLNKKQRAQNRRVKQQRSRTVAARRILSDKDLEKAYNRIQLERKLKDISDRDLHPARTAIKDAIKKSGNRVLPALATAGATGLLAYAATKSKRRNIKAGSIVGDVTYATSKAGKGVDLSDFTKNVNKLVYTKK